MSRIRRHLTYSNVMVTVLAFVVLGGTAWAVAHNSIGTKQLKSGAVHTADLADNAVTSAKLAPGLLGTTRSATSSIPLTCTESNIGATYFLSCTGKATATAPCGSGEHATGGGYTTPTPPGTSTPPSSSAQVVESRPDPATDTPTGWAINATGSGFNSGNAPGLAHPPDPQVTVYAICSG
jgi:hypothetical protein